MPLKPRHTTIINTVPHRDRPYPTIKPREREKGKMFSVLPTPRKSQHHHYTPQFSSPLSSSPLKSPLSPRHENLQTPFSFDRQPEHHHQYDKLMSSPTRIAASKRESPCSAPGGVSMTPSQPIFHSLTTPPTSTRSFSTTPRSSNPSSQKQTPFSKRPSKPNPLLQDRTEGRETRRKLFLKRVREDAEEKKWKDRGGDEEIMRVLWVGETRRLEEKRRREESRLGIGIGLEEEELSLDEVMAEQVAKQEEEELDALIETLNQDAGIDHASRCHLEENVDWNLGRRPDDSMLPEPPSTPAGTNYGSDDDEYDSIFMDVIEKEIRMSSQQPQSMEQFCGGDQDMMDLS